MPRCSRILGTSSGLLFHQTKRRLDLASVVKSILAQLAIPTSPLDSAHPIFRRFYEYSRRGEHYVDDDFERSVCYPRSILLVSPPTMPSAPLL